MAIRLVRQLPRVPQWPSDDFIGSDGKLDHRRWAKYMRDQNVGAIEWYREYQEGLNRALNVPSFHVDRNNVNQLAVANGATTPIQFTNNSTGNAFDSHGYWDLVNFRYLPLIAGTFIFGGSVRFVAVAAMTSVQSFVAKNGGAAVDSGRIIAPGVVSPVTFNVILLQMNGKTDYIQFNAAQDSGGPQDINGSAAATQGWGYKVSD